MSRIAVRAASLSDAEAIRDLMGELGYEANTQEISNRLSVLLGRSSHLVAVVAVEDVVAGWIAAERRMILESGERVEIVGLVVSSDYRRLGLGRSLVAAAEQWCADQGLSRVFVRSNVVRDESHVFYESVGYERRKTQHAYSKPIGGN